jgi:hypothetical protein
MRTLIATIALFGFICNAQDYNKLNQYSQNIDSILEAQYKKSNIKGNDIINDDQFVRRAYLTIIGRIPTIEEYDNFINAQVPTKRQELIKYLLKHPGYTSNLYNFWADSLRLKERLTDVNNFNGGPYIQYIKDQIKKNVPHTQFVRGLLTASGSYYDNPQTGYYYRDLGMPLDNLIGTMKVFGGTDISCAQCHDDPFQDFSQLEFYELAAFFTQVELRGKTDPKLKDRLSGLRKEVEELVKSDPIKNRGLNNQINNFVRATQANVDVVETKTIKLPHDYQYTDKKPNEVVAPKFLKSSGDVTNKSDLRVDAVNWLTSPEHPTFTKNISNRYWRFIFGRYIIEEFDNIQDSPLLTGDLMNMIHKIMVDCGYNIQHFLYVLLNTKLFQRDMYEGPYANSESFVFIGPIKQRLTAEQLWDSILSIALEKPEQFQTTFQSKYSEVMKTSVEDLTVSVIKTKLDAYGKVLQTKYEGAPRYKNYMLVRASEINDQTGSNNVIQQLGRSDRELIQTSSLEGSVTQVISFMNGQIGEIATAKDLKLMKLIQTKTPTEKIEMIFKATLSRKPTIEEKSQFANVPDDDIIWALINTNQFKFTK